MSAYYNEHDPFAAEWLRELIKAGAIAPGVVDERSIDDVLPADLDGFSQCHFFAGIGTWSFALRQAGWPDDRPVWTGSCPCQPFSSAGKGAGFADERHLWPAWHWLIRNAKPRDVPVFGEQVASKDGLAWLDLVQTDLEGEGYAVWPVDLCAAGVGAPHIRQRLWFVAERLGDNSGEGLAERIGNGRIQPRTLGALQGQAIERRGDVGGLANANRREQQRFAELRGIKRDWQDSRRPEGCGEPQSYGELCRLADSHRNGCVPRREAAENSGHRGSLGTAGRDAEYGQPGPTNGHWQDADWLFCRDGKWRAVEPAFKQMVDGFTCAVVYLRDGRESEEVKKVMYEATNNPYAREAMRAMWEADVPEAVWLKTGRQLGFYEATILFACMLEQAGQLGRFIDSAASGGPEASKAVLREVREGWKTSRSSLGREYTQQPAEQFTDALSKLPQTPALELLRTLNGSPLVNGAAARVGRLRGYGNGIVAQAAQAFIGAAMEVLR